VIGEFQLIVIIPAFNEQDSLPVVLQALKDVPQKFAEIIVVDNGSTDETSLLAKAAGATVLSETERGYGAACLRGIGYLREKYPDTKSQERVVVIFMDGDHSDYPEDLGALIQPIIRNDAHFVVGSRLRRSDARRAVTVQARWGNLLAVSIIRLIYGFRFTDLGPFRAIRLDRLFALEMKDRNWGWTLEMQLKACKARISIEEVPVRYRLRYAGKSKISRSLWGSSKAAAKILWVLGKHAVSDR